MKQKYRIAIEESFVQEFDIYADDAEQAFTQAVKRYQSGELTLESKDPSFKQISIIKPSVEASEWVEF